MSTITLRFAELLERYHHLSGKTLTMAELIQQAGLSSEQQAAVEVGSDQLTLASVARLCDVLGCQPHNLFTYHPDGEEEHESEIESRHIVKRWEAMYGADEHPPS